MLVAFVHGGYTYRVMIDHPDYAHHYPTSYEPKIFPSLYHAKFFVKNMDLKEDERAIIEEIETGNYMIARTNRKPAEEITGEWKQLGF